MATNSTTPQYSDLPPGAGSLPNQPVQAAPPQYSDLPAGAVSLPNQQTSTPTPAPGTTDDTVWGGIKRGANSVYNTVAGIAPPTNTDAATTLPGKALGLPEDVAGAINNLTGITTVTDSLKSAGHIIDAY